MSYIDCLNSFNLWLESHALEPVSQLLYFKLLNVFNRAGWPESVQVDNLRIMTMTGQHSEKTATAARDRLVSAGLISYQRGKKNSPGRYSLIPIPCNFYGEFGGEMGGYQGGYSASGCQTYKDKEQDKEQDSSPPNPPAGGTGNPPASSPEPEKPNRRRNPATSPELTPDEESTLLAFSPGLCDVTRDWFRYKAERRQMYKPTGRQQFIQRVLDNAQRYGADAVISVIRNSMSNGYQGVTWDKLPQMAASGARNQPEETWAELAARMEREGRKI